MSVLDSFTPDKKFQGITEIANNLDIQKSTVHTILNTLKEEGYIIYDQATKKYCLGYKILELSKRITYRMDLRKLAYPIMEELSKKCEEDIALNILVENKRLCVELVESRYFVRQFVPIGKALPLHCSAAGKALLAFLPNTQITEIIGKTGLQRFTDKTITDKATLINELDSIVKNRFAESYEEYGKDAAAIAFPVFNEKEDIIASISIQSTINRISDEIRKLFISYGKESAEKLTMLLRSLE